VQLLLRPGDALTVVQKRGELGPVMPVLNECVSLQDGFEPLAGAAGPVPDPGEVVQVAGDLAIVPGGQDRLDVGEVLVQRGAPDAGLRGDLGHRHRGQPMLGDQGRGSVQRRVVHRPAMRLDRVRP
jgi:hypothetical protein